MTVSSNQGGPTTLNQRVEAAADAMLSQGIRPNFALVRASVRGPGDQVSGHLEEWVLRRRTRAGHTMQMGRLHSRMGLTRVSGRSPVARNPSLSRPSDIPLSNRRGS